MKLSVCIISAILCLSLFGGCGGKGAKVAGDGCSYEDPCEENMLCIANNDGSRTGKCRNVCSSDADCTDGEGCIKVDGDEMVCLPVSELNEHIADECTKDSDCIQGWCVSLDDKFVCALLCESAGDCSGSTTCRGTQDKDGNVIKACLP